MLPDDLADVGHSKGTIGLDHVQWGLASLVVGMGLVVAAPIALIFNVVFWRSGPSGLPVVPAFVGAVLGLVVVLRLVVFGITAGFRGRSRTARGSEPSPLATAGMLAGLTAMVLWLVVGIDLLAILLSFER